MPAEQDTAPTGAGWRPRIAIIGLGFGGIAMCVRLARAGLNDYVVFEASEDAGGTWWHNTYPGAAVDTASHLYSFSFKRYDWSQRFASQRELLQYLHETVTDWEIRPHVRFSTPVTTVTWDDDTSTYTLVTADGAAEVFDIVISAVGLLNVAKVPVWEGADEFEGTVVHTAQWKDTIDVAGRQVAVVGTGSSAAQVIPAVAETAGHVTVFQRHPAWVDYKEPHGFSAAERAILTTRLGYFYARARLYAQSEINWLGGRVITPGSRADRKALARCQRHLQESFADDPDMLEMLTPTTPYLGKRPVRSNEYLPALKRDNVSLVPQAVVRLTKNGVVDATGNVTPVDILIAATGFRPAEFLSGLDVVAGGRSIHDHWGSDPTAYLGICVPQFPNFFMLYGPNTNYYAIVFNLERQADFITRVLLNMSRRGRTRAEVRRSWHDGLNRWLTRRLANSSFASTDSYFRSSSGKVVTQWPDGALPYWALTRFTSRWAVRLSNGGAKRSSGDDAVQERIAHVTSDR